MNKELYFKDKIYKIEKAIEGLKLCYEWFSYEDITSKIKHLESEAEKLKSFIGKDYIQEDEEDEYLELYDLELYDLEL